LFYENEVFPRAKAIGISWDEFWKMNPRILDLHIKAHQEWIKEQDYLAWLQGRYIYQGISVALSHFANKNSTAEYPEMPYMEKEVSDEEKASRMGEEQKTKQAENYMLRLQLMATNWNMNNKDKNSVDKSGSVS
jgi:hypothetical protein